MQSKHYSTLSSTVMHFALLCSVQLFFLFPVDSRPNVVSVLQSIPLNQGRMTPLWSDFEPMWHLDWEHKVIIEKAGAPISFLAVDQMLKSLSSTQASSLHEEQGSYFFPLTPPFLFPLLRTPTHQTNNSVAPRSLGGFCKKSLRAVQENSKWARSRGR